MLSKIKSKRKIPRIKMFQSLLWWKMLSKGVFAYRGNDGLVFQSLLWWKMLSKNSNHTRQESLC